MGFGAWGLGLGAWSLWLIDSGRGITAEDARGTPTQRHASPSVLLYKNDFKNLPPFQVEKEASAALDSLRDRAKEVPLLSHTMY